MENLIPTKSGYRKKTCGEGELTQLYSKILSTSIFEVGFGFLKTFSQGMTGALG